MECPFCFSVLPEGAWICPACGAYVGGAFQALPAGRTVYDGRYTIERVLGRGGFGITYRAVHNRLLMRVAIKELFPEGATRLEDGFVVPPAGLGQKGMEEARQRFLEEARTLAQFNHPGIVRVIDVFEENGTAYLAMEYLEGDTLARRILRQGRLPVDEVEEVARKVAAALTVVHAAGLLHRDVKPENIYLTNDGRVVLIDFGSARAFVQGVTTRHTRVVTPGYAAPEQYASQARVGPATDIYGLGATLYHALTGSPPPPAPDRLLGDQLVPLPAWVSPNLRLVVERALAINADDRPQTTADFLAILEARSDPEVVRLARVSAGRPVTPPPPGALQPTLGEVLAPHIGAVADLAFSPDGTLLASASADKTIAIFDRQAGTVQLLLQGHTAGVNAVAFAPDGELVASGSWDRTVRLWSLTNGKRVGQLIGHEEGVYSLAFSPDGHLLASSGFDRVVRLWAVRERSLLRRLRGHSDAVLTVAFSPDGSLLATGSMDGTVRLWRITDGEAVGTVRAHQWVMSVRFSPRADLLVSAGADGLVKLWRLPDLALLGVLKGHRESVQAVAISPDGNFLASASKDRTVRLWRLVDQILAHVLEDHPERVQAVAFAPDGQLLACGLADGSVWFWNLG